MKKFMRRFLHRFQKIDIYRPYLPLSLISMTLTDIKKWWSRSSSNIWNHISTIHVLYLDFYTEFKNMMYDDLIWTISSPWPRCTLRGRWWRSTSSSNIWEHLCVLHVLYIIKKNFKNWPHPYFWTWSTPPPYTSRCPRGSWSWYQFICGS